MASKPRLAGPSPPVAPSVHEWVRDAFAQLQNEKQNTLSSWSHTGNQRLPSGLGWENHSSPLCGEFPDCA